MTLGQFTEPRLLIPHLLSDRQDTVIQELTERLETTGRIANAQVFLEAVLKREAQLPTFVGQNVAVPHMRDESLQRISLTVGMSPVGMPWGRAQSRVANVMFLFAVPLKEMATYLSLLSDLSRLIHDETAFNTLQQAKQSEQMLSVLNCVRLGQRTTAPALPL